ncbi:hypothetical protein D5086_015116 [Populus alba]|uniref:Uncharacterized protein n=1 Tax=Populus alba TaxID=43335 RepID=A0ACC4C070_POPAL
METADSTKPFLMKARIHFKLGEDSVLEPDVFSREAGAVVPVPEIKASEAENDCVAATVTTEVVTGNSVFRKMDLQGIAE